MARIQILLNELDTFNLPVTEYVIIGSGPLAIRDIRETNDLDILVNDELWDKLSKKYAIVEKNGFQFIHLSRNIEVHGKKSFPKTSGEDPSQEENINDAEIIENHPFQSIKHFLYYKRKGTREKDVNDVMLLENWLKKQ